MCLKPNYVKGMQVACGKCIECKVKRSNEWAFRIVHECSKYKNNCMVTLTYNDENLPLNGTLVKSDLQKFVKRLRRHIEPLKVRYFACGEYGSKGLRPHYHIILFGFDFEDKFFFKKDKKGSLLYRSPTLEKLWSFGFSSIGEVNLDTAKYCAVYLQKPLKDKSKINQFTLMSRNPGIGLIDDKYLVSDKVYIDGKYIPTPRYYLDKLSIDFEDEVVAIREKRQENGKKNYLVPIDIQLEENKRRIKKFERFFNKRLDKDKMI